MENPNMPYEGAGFFLTYGSIAILAKRLKKLEDLGTTPEGEYIGGKPEPEDGNDPSQTAWCELVEEVGADILCADWKQRVRIHHYFQPFSKKWIWVFRIELNHEEYERLEQANKALQEWPRIAGASQEDVRESYVTKDFSHLTGRKAKASRALKSIVIVERELLRGYIAQFGTIASTSNRMKDAKEFGKHSKIDVTNMDDGNKQLLALRAFNIVIFEDRLDFI